MARRIDDVMANLTNSIRGSMISGDNPDTVTVFFGVSNVIAIDFDDNVRKLVIVTKNPLTVFFNCFRSFLFRLITSSFQICIGKFT